jgi:hypothetical protein
MKTSPRELVAAAALALAAAYVLSEILALIDRARMARYDPADLPSEVEEFLGEHNAADAD